MKKLSSVLLVICLFLIGTNQTAGEELSLNPQPLSLAQAQTGGRILPQMKLDKEKWPQPSRKKKFWDKKRTKVGFSFSVDYWMPKGSFSMVGSPPDAYNKWKLKHPVDSNLYIGSLATFELKVSHVIMIDVTYGGGDLKKGRLVDTDWDKDGNVRDLAYATSKGKTQYLSGFLSYRLVGSCPLVGEGLVPSQSGRPQGSPLQPDQTSRATLDISLGYHQLKNSVSYKNPRILIKNYSASNESWKEVINKYDLTYSGIGIRLKGEYRMNRAWSIRGLIGYLPSVNARYRGVRNPKREPDPDDPPAGRLAERIKAKGQAPEAEIKLCLYPTTNLSCWVGYKSISFKAEGKDESGTYWAGSEEKLKTNLAGWLFGFGYQF